MSESSLAMSFVRSFLPYSTGQVRIMVPKLRKRREFNESICICVIVGFFFSLNKEGIRVKVEARFQA